MRQTKQPQQHVTVLWPRHCSHADAGYLVGWSGGTPTAPMYCVAAVVPFSSLLCGPSSQSSSSPSSRSSSRSSSNLSPSDPATSPASPSVTGASHAAPVLTASRLSAHRSGDRCVAAGCPCAAASAECCATRKLDALLGSLSSSERYRNELLPLFRHCGGAPQILGLWYSSTLPPASEASEAVSVVSAVSVPVPASTSTSTAVSTAQRGVGSSTASLSSCSSSRGLDSCSNSSSSQCGCVQRTDAFLSTLSSLLMADKRAADADAERRSPTLNAAQASAQLLLEMRPCAVRQPSGAALPELSALHSLVLSSSASASASASSSSSAFQQATSTAGNAHSMTASEDLGNAAASSAMMFNSSREDIFLSRSNRLISSSSSVVPIIDGVTFTPAYVLLKRFVDMTGIVLTSSAWRKLEGDPSLRAPFTAIDLACIDTKVKHTNLINNVEGTFLHVEAMRTNSSEAALDYFSHAISKFEDALKASPNNKQTLMNCANTSAKMLEVEFSQGGRNLSNVVFDMQDLRVQKTDEFFCRALDVAAGEPDAVLYFHYARFLERCSRFERAENYFLRALEANPNYERCLRAYLRFLIDTGRENESTLLLERARAIQVITQSRQTSAM